MRSVVYDEKSIYDSNCAPALFFFTKRLTRYFSYYSCIYNYTMDSVL
jgi:hypothetical protein